MFYFIAVYLLINLFWYRMAYVEVAKGLDRKHCLRKKLQVCAMMDVN